MKDVCRVKTVTKEVATPYSDDLNDAVYLMYEKIRTLTILFEKEKAVTEALQKIVPKSGAAPRGPEKPVSFAVPAMEDGMPEAFWKRIRKEFKTAADDVVERGRSGF